MIASLQIRGMCKTCVPLIEKTIREMEGAQNIRFDLEKGVVTFDNTGRLDVARVQKTVLDVLRASRR